MLIADSALCNFTFMMGKLQIHPSAMNIELRSRGILQPSLSIRYASLENPRPMDFAIA